MERYEQIKAIRKATGLSQKEFGRRIGVSRDMIAALESGRVQTVQPVFFEHLCEVYKVSSRWLETGEEPVLIDESEELYRQAVSIFDSLSARYQKSALEQIRILLDLQNAEDE